MPTAGRSEGRARPVRGGPRHWCRLRALARVVSCCLALLSAAQAAHAQLRPLEPIAWRALEGGADARAALGLGLLHDQRASLAGTRGTLLEIGNWLLTFRSGRFALEFAGTALRRFEDDEILAQPFVRSDPPDGDARVDAGDVRLATIVRLFGHIDESILVLRFGTRLPTTSDEPGLDRDRTDFFATVAGRYRLVDGLRIFTEAGVGIHSTVLEHYPQSDVLIYGAGVEAGRTDAGIRLQVSGHDDFHRRVIRGNEDLAELRLGGWIGERRRIEAHLVRGLAEFSPGWGVLVSGGMALW